MFDISSLTLFVYHTYFGEFHYTFVNIHPCKSTLLCNTYIHFSKWTKSTSSHFLQFFSSTMDGRLLIKWHVSFILFSCHSFTFFSYPLSFLHPISCFWKYCHCHLDSKHSGLTTLIICYSNLLFSPSKLLHCPLHVSFLTLSQQEANEASLVEEEHSMGARSSESVGFSCYPGDCCSAYRQYVGKSLSPPFTFFSSPLSLPQSFFCPVLFLRVKTITHEVRCSDYNCPRFISLFSLLSSPLSLICVLTLSFRCYSLPRARDSPRHSLQGRQNHSH